MVFWVEYMFRSWSRIPGQVRPKHLKVDVNNILCLTFSIKGNQWILFNQGSKFNCWCLANSNLPKVECLNRLLKKKMREGAWPRRSGEGGVEVITPPLWQI